MEKLTFTAVKDEISAGDSSQWLGDYLIVDQHQEVYMSGLSIYTAEMIANAWTDSYITEN